MKITRAAIACAVLLGFTACKPDVGSPEEHLRPTMADNVELTAGEQRLLNEISRDLPEHMRKGLAQGGMVFVKDPKLQEKINSFRSAIGARMSAENATRPFVAPPRTAENSWEPSAEEEALISAYLRTLNPEVREFARDRLLRNNTQLFGTDQKSKKMLAHIYDVRNKRWEAEAKRER